MSNRQTTFAFAFCCGFLALATGSFAAQETAKPVTATAAAKSAKGTTTASLAKPANELPDANAENATNSVGVAAIVNDAIISDYDLRQRLALLAATSGVRPQNDEQKKALRSQVLRQLETEKMQTQEANRKNIVVSSDDVDKAIENITKENNLTVDKLKEVLGQSGVYISTLRSQIAVQIAWQKAVEDEFGDEVRLKPSDVDQEYARVKAGAVKPHFLVAEIFLGVDNPEQDTKIKADAQRIREQLLQGAAFNTMARQLSQSPSAASGGDLGAVEQGQLAPELDAALTKLQIGEISEPIRSVGGYYLILLRRRWEPAGTKVDQHAPESMVASNATPLGRVLLVTGPNPAKNILDAALTAAQQLRERIQSCDLLEKAIPQMRGVSYQNLSRMGLHLSDLSEQIQQQVAKTEPGGATVPFVSPAGVELIVRCDKAVPKLEVWAMPTKEQVENQLFQERIASMARGYLARLKRNADVQDR